MPERRATNYIERLPEIIDREESDISHLDREMVEILYPHRASKEFRIDIEFSSPAPNATAEQSELYREAVGVAERAADYESRARNGRTTHRAGYGVDEANRLHELFAVAGDLASCEVLVNGKRVPYARELWLPLFWFFKKDDD
jgi:hypothetical protein